MSEGPAEFPVPLRGAIVAMTRNRIIGVDGGMPWHYGEDLKRFKGRTLGCAVLMGRVTWDSIGRKELPGRRNIVISRSPVPGVEHYDGIEQAMAACGEQDLWVIGGAQIYRAAMAYLTLLDITWVPDVIERGVECGDIAEFPEIDGACWRAVEESALSGEAGLVNVIYRRVDRPSDASHR